MLKRYAVFVYGLACYAVFFGTYLYAIGFVANIFVPHSIDAPATGDTAANLLVDVALLLAFAVQHSVMARRGFKQWLTRFVPEPAERSTYVLASSVALIALFAFWRPLGGTVWSVDEPGARHGAQCPVRRRLAARPGLDVSHQPLRPLRAAPGLAAPDGDGRTGLSASARRDRIGSSVIRSTSAGSSRSGRRRR